MSSQSSSSSSPTKKSAPAKLPSVDELGGGDPVDVMTDADFERALDALREDGDSEVGDLLKLMNENSRDFEQPQLNVLFSENCSGIISWEEAERILGDSSNEPVKSSLPQQTRPTEPDNDTDVASSIQKLMANDPRLVEINLNNMKVGAGCAVGTGWAGGCGESSYKVCQSQRKALFKISFTHNDPIKPSHSSVTEESLPVSLRSSADR